MRNAGKPAAREMHDGMDRDHDRGDSTHAHHHHGGHRDDGPATEQGTRSNGHFAEHNNRPRCRDDVGGRAAEAEHHSGVVDAERKEQETDPPTAANRI